MANTKIVYQTDADGSYIGEAVAFESPLEPGVFHIPAGCVESEPPSAPPNNAARWSDGAWIVVPDHRGETWYSGATPIVIDFLGDPSEHDLSASPPPPDLATAISTKIAAISATAAALLATGAPVGDGLHVALDDGSRADLTAMAATATAAASGAVPWPESYSRGWITVENIRIPLATPADGLALAASVGDYYAAIIQHRRDLKDAVLVAEDAVALDAIDETDGWPA